MQKVKLLEKYNKAIPRYTSYPTAVEWSSAYSELSYKQDLIAFTNQVESTGDSSKDDRSGDFSLYVHIPFCEQRCYYCACHVIIDKNRSYVTKYLDYLEKELNLFSSVLKRKQSVSQLHLGGGTPTFLNVEELERLYAMLERHFNIRDNAEIAIEIDPAVTSKEQLDTLRKLNFNRISMGVQDFDKNVQKAVNRDQDERQIIELIEHARSLGFGGINLDFIYGLPLQSVLSFEKTIDKVIEIGIDRIALFSYAQVPWLKPHQRNISPLDIPSTKEKFAIFLLARDKLIKSGYVPIGMDHFARHDDELAIALYNKALHRNFMGYTVGSARNYLGFGVSSIGFVNDSFVQNVKTLRLYYDSIDKGKLPIERGLKLDDDDIIRKWVIEALMCQFELDFASFALRFNKSFKDYFSLELSSLKEFIDDGFLSINEDKLVVSSSGSLFIRNIASSFDKYLKIKQEKRFSKAI